MSTDEREQLEEAIAALEAQRGILGDNVVEASLSALQEKLATLSQTAPDESRKQVTVLFADLAGWTKMSESLDPEEVHEVQGQYFSAVTPPIQAYGGSIEKYIGDAILAVFGVPQAREDDPKRAVRAALEMQAELNSLNRRLASERNISLGLRIGVHTGLVFASVSSSAREFLITGDTVNTAARLEGAAPVSGILISESTYRLVEGSFSFQAMDPLVLKGKQAPLAVYRVEGAQTRRFRAAGRGIKGLAVPMIGRDAELQALQESIGSVVQQSGLRLVTLVGEAGVGKSRLLLEYESWAASSPLNPKFLKGRATPETQKAPFGLLRSVFALHCWIKDGDTAAHMQEKFQNGLEPFINEGQDPSLKVSFIGQMLGYDFSDSQFIKPALDDPEQIYDRGMIYLAEFFEGIAKQGPLLILLEDVHWADDSSLEGILKIVRNMPGRPIQLVVAARPEFLRQHPEWPDSLDNYQQLDLENLSKNNSRLLVETIFQKAKGLPRTFQDELVRAGEGNPYFLEELVKMLIEEGAIKVLEEHWQIERSTLTGLRIPATLTAVLQARLDLLHKAERTTLQQAAVVGRQFWDQAIRHIQAGGAGDDSPNQLISTLDSLAGRELIFHQEPSSFPETVEFFFKHALLRDVTYESVLKRKRRQYHGVVADWLLTQSRERKGEILGLVGDHLEKAGRAPEAAQALAQAGQEAAARYANDEAIAYFQRAVEMMERNPPEEKVEFDLVWLYEHLGDLFGLKRQAPEARAAYGQAIQKLPEDAHMQLAGLYRKQGNFFDDYSGRREAYDRAETALGPEPPGKDPAWWAEWIELQIARLNMYYAHYLPDETDAVEPEIRSALEVYGSRDQLMQFTIATISHTNVRDRFVIPDHRIAETRRLLDWAIESGNPRRIASQEFSLGFHLLWNGDPEAALPELQSAMQSGQQVGDAWIVAVSLVYQGFCYRLLGEAQSLAEILPDMANMADETGLSLYAGIARANQGWLAWRDGQVNEAEALLTPAIEAINPDYPFRWVGLLPMLAVRLEAGNLSETIHLCEKLLGESQRPLPEPMEEVCVQAWVAWSAGHTAEAEELASLLVDLSKEHNYL